MKKTALALALALLLSLLCGGVAQAQAPEEKSGFLGWLSQSWETLGDTLGPKYEAFSQSVKETTAEWKGTVESFIAEKGWDEELRGAWQTLLDAANHAKNVTAEEAAAAYQLMHDWIAENDSKFNQTLAEALDKLAAAAGVTEAALSNWYRTAEAFLNEHRDSMSDAVRQAWDTIREAQAEGSILAEEALRSAYATIDDWLRSVDGKEAAEAHEALDHILAM